MFLHRQVCIRMDGMSKNGDLAKGGPSQPLAYSAGKVLAGQFHWWWRAHAVHHLYYFQVVTAFRSGLRVVLQVARGRLARGHR